LLVAIVAAAVKVMLLFDNSLPGNRITAFFEQEVVLAV
jgi:hypothetical protein